MAATAGASMRARHMLHPQPLETPASDRLIWDPAGADRLLSSARQDVSAGRFTAAKDLLTSTGRDGDLRCQRLLVLAQAGLDGVAAEAWVQEQPDDPNARMFLARVLVLQAVAAVRRHSPAAFRLVRAAVQACHQAGDCTGPADPAPNVALLHLAGVYPVREAPPDAALADAQGPWRLMQTVWSQDTCNREAHQRMLVAVQTASDSGAMYIAARWLAGYARPGSVMHLLPLVARVVDLRKALADANDDSYGMRFNRELQWTDEIAFQEIKRAYEQWFLHCGQQTPVLADIHVLAHAAYMARLRTSRAGEVLAMARRVLDEAGPYACSQPWSLTATSGDVGAELLAARRACGTSPPQ